MQHSTGILVVGQVARDLVLGIEGMPEGGGSAEVRERREMLGGKGANQAVGLIQLGASVRMLGVVGDDETDSFVLEQARADGIDVEHVIRRGTTALLLDIVEADGTRRLFEDVPESALLTADDIRAHESAFDGVDTVILQLQQPTDALLAAAELARDRGIRLVLDGAIEGPERDRLLGLADVLRADATEASILTGVELGSRDDAKRAAIELLAKGPSLVAVAVPGQGDLVVWDGGEVFTPLGDEEVVDPTGAGDAFVAGLVTGLRAGHGQQHSAELAHAAAGATVTRLGGRPDLTGLR
ncbi:PfkB family carbohydrate kinase [Salinibacterium sp. SYSU T00001]|uniref:PfkB family carbohydrate kinase n=1 Tax=Homoserinimonas sedimenticola TaxID=2986805 RepID=UPI002236B2F7|nr:PfkB family carbohydrate kinase [Salinibacterium sedimenticola]MCW4386102.1 PfkB family carbohydrate kinase [Salinibacterium sedimenticola]